jgi:miniconductance mechanosensitive channel
MEYFNQLFIRNGLGANFAKHLSIIISIIIIGIICVVVTIVIRKFVLRLLAKYIKKTRIKSDDFLWERRVFHKIGNLIPVIIVYSSAKYISIYESSIQKLAIVCIFIVIMSILNSTLDAVNDYYKVLPISKVRSIKGLLQTLKILVIIVIAIIIVAIIIEKSPLLLLSGIGAVAAVFSFVFKDSILGLVAGIQLSSNDMLRLGDWIEMSKFGVNGDVIDISLTTIKIRDFENAIVTIPAYTLISDSFKNWRGMKNAGARRMKKSIYIDINSIHFCTNELIEKFRAIDCLREYFIKKVEEANYNKIDQDGHFLIDGTYQTNIEIFRIYIQNYLKNHNKVNQEMIQMVRELSSTDHGIPLEIYTFINDTNWVRFEAIQAEIMDHICACVQIFDLKIYQKPSGHDIKDCFYDE